MSEEKRPVDLGAGGQDARRVEVEEQVNTPAASVAQDAEEIDAPPIPQVYSLETIEQLRTIADPLRARIYDLLVRQPLTAKQVGVALGEAPAKIHYHVRELERVGLVKLVETRERGGILEKYYRAVARILDTPPGLLQSQPDAVLAAARDSLALITRGFLRTLEYSLRHEKTDVPPLTIDGSTLWVTKEEYHELLCQIAKLYEAYQAPRGVEGEREVYQAMLGYDARIGLSEEQALSVPTQSEMTQPKGKRRVVVMIGAEGYNRAGLEAVLAEGRQIDLTVFGVCTFADDVTPDLIERAIVHFRHRGKLIASKEVRAALKLKEG